MTQPHRIQNGRMMMITTNTLRRRPIFADDVHACIAVESLYKTQERKPFFLYGFVVMPDHCHILLRIPEYNEMSKIIYMYKRSVAFDLQLGHIWQRRFDCRLIKRPMSCLNYIHQNPVKAGLVQHQVDYPWSSASGKWDVQSWDWFG